MKETLLPEEKRNKILVGILGSHVVYASRYKGAGPSAIRQWKVAATQQSVCELFCSHSARIIICSLIQLIIATSQSGREGLTEFVHSEVLTVEHIQCHFVFLIYLQGIPFISKTPPKYAFNSRGRQTWSLDPLEVSSFLEYFAKQDSYCLGVSVRIHKL
jgi:hypothetical protein